MAAASPPIDDRWFRAVGIPGFGLSIPHLTGLLGPIGPSDARYWLGHAYFVALAAAIWQGNRWLLFAQRRHAGWFDRPLQKIVLLLGAVTLYTAPVTVLALAGWYLWAELPRVDWATVQVVALVNVICVVFVTHVYETVFLIKEREADLVRVAQLERSRAQATLEALRAQIAPHFLFNSLTALAQLIDTDPPRAAAFNRDLARVYRYILLNRDRDLVPLADELEFLASYLRLVALRFGDAVRLVQRGDADPRRLLIPPTAVQTLVENAVKHNVLDAAAPMDIELVIEPRCVTVSNPRRRKQAARGSAGLGLANLAERCRLVVNRTLEIDQDERRFSVRVPVIDVAAG